jgi:thiol-disulfide isomerase/thioredoxin
MQPTFEALVSYCQKLSNPIIAKSFSALLVSAFMQLFNTETTFAASELKRVNTGLGSRNSEVSPGVQATDAVTAAQRLCRIPLNCASWQPLIDPKNPEFWREGNHVPDAGYLQLFKEMTPESAKLLILRGEIKALYMQKALALLENAQRELVQAGLVRDRYNTVTASSPQIVRQNVRQQPTPQLHPDQLKGLQYFFIFSPTCPHCKRLAESLMGLQNVYPLQADKSAIFHFPGMHPSEYATSETLKKYAPDGAVPVLVIHRMKDNRAVVLRGSMSAEEVLMASAQLLGSKGDG